MIYKSYISKQQKISIICNSKPLVDVPLRSEDEQEIHYHADYSFKSFWPTLLS